MQQGSTGKDLAGIFWGFVIIGLIGLGVRYWIVSVTVAGVLIVIACLVHAARRPPKLARAAGKPGTGAAPVQKTLAARLPEPADEELAGLEQQVSEARARNDGIRRMKEQARQREEKSERLRAELERLDEELRGL